MLELIYFGFVVRQYPILQVCDDGFSILGRYLGGAPALRPVDVGFRDVLDRDFPPKLMFNSRPQIGEKVSVIVLRPGDLLEGTAEEC